MKNALAFNTVLLWGADILGKGLRFFLVIAVAHLLGDEGLGKYAFAFSFVGLFGIFQDMGIAPYMVREMAKKPGATQKYFSNMFSLKIFFVAGLFLISIAAAYVTQAPDVQLAVLLAAASMSVYYFSILMGNVLQAHEKIPWISFLNLVEQFSTTLLALALLYFGGSLFWLLVGVLIANSITLLFYLFYASKIVKMRLAFDFEFMKEMIRGGLPFWFTTLFSVIYFRVDTVMLSFMAGFDATGWYNAAYRALDALSFIPGAILMAVYPVMSRLSVGNLKELRQLFSKIMYYLFMIGLPIAIGTTLVADRLLPAVYPGSFDPSILVLQIIIWAAPVIFLSSVTGQLLNAIDKAKLFTLTAGIGAGFNVVLNFILIPQYQHVGASIATIITEIIVLIVLFYFAARHSFSFSFLGTFFKPILSGLLMGIMILAISDFHLVLVIPAAAATYFLALIAIRGITREDMKLVLSVLSRSR